MSLLSRLGIASVIAVAVSCYGCTSNSDEHLVSTSEGHAVYKIWKHGEIIQNENYDVALVYGFGDNRFVAEQIAEFLNQEEPNAYFVYEVD